MKRTESFSPYALLIALLLHLILILALLLLDRIESVVSPAPFEQRFRLSLQERPDVIKEAIVPNQAPVTAKALPIPKGEQLIRPEISPAPPPARHTPPAPVERAQEAAAEKAFVRHTAKPVASIQRLPKPKKETELYDILSTPDPSAQEKPLKHSTKITDTIERLYGDAFNELSAGEQKYILDNQEIMRRITQGVLDRYGRSRIPDTIRINDVNMIEFYLHPDGSISDIRFLTNSRLSILDDTTKEVIELSYAKYPRPQQKTLIRYRVHYDLGGY